MQLRRICYLILFAAISATGCSANRSQAQRDASVILAGVPAEATGSMSRNISPEEEARQEAIGATFMELVASNDARNPILPDQNLIAKFQDHRVAFERLVKMISSDPDLQRVDYYWTIPSNPASIGVSTERIKEYRDLLDDVGCHRGFGADAGQIYFISAAQGLVISGREQGYYYSKTIPSPLVTDTIAYRPPEKTDSWKAFRRIDGDWYIYFAEN